MYRLVGGIAILLAGCANLDLDPFAAWQAELQPTGPEPVTGRVALATEGSANFAAGIDIEGLVGAVYGWEVAAGSCAAPGPRIGGLATYPDVTAADSIAGSVGRGRGKVQRVVGNAQLSTSGRYHGRVVRAGERTAVLACGDLLRAGS